MALSTEQQAVLSKLLNPAQSASELAKKLQQKAAEEVAPQTAEKAIEPEASSP